MGRILAAADIGSNTVHLLVADITKQAFRRLRNEADWLSLGEVVSREGSIPEAKLARLIATLQNFKSIAKSAQAEDFYVFATEAMRVASNHGEIIQRIRKEVGIEVDLIPATREAALSMRGCLLDIAPEDPCVLLEVGGGSAQVALCENGELLDERSLPVGTGRLIAEYGIEQPVTREIVERLQQDLPNLISEAGVPSHAKFVIGSGGVARGFVRALHPDGAHEVQRFELDYLLRSAAELTVDQISMRFSVKVKRATTLVPGALVFCALLDHFVADRMRVSEYGVREGAILELAEGFIRCRA